MSSTVTEHKDWKLLYTYWTDLEFLKNDGSEKYFNIMQSEVKNFIIKYIRNGVRDEYSKINDLPRRHAFTAKELHEAFKKQSDEDKYSISNFHFHIKALVKDGYLKKITTIPEGRQNHNYYGRTAITFIPHYDEQYSEQTNQTLFNPLKKLIKGRNPDLDESFIDKLIEESIQSTEDYYLRIFSWFEGEYSHLYESGMELRELINYVANFIFFHEKMYSKFKEIGSLIGLDKIENYPIYKTNSEMK